MKFADPHRITKIGFYCLGYYAPRSFDIIGSSDCAAPWTVLLHVAEKYDYRKIFKTWVVPPQKRQAFRCIGIKVETIMEDDPEDPNPVMLKNIQMWEEL